jgi:ketosteroid isomerase-like protein
MTPSEVMAEIVNLRHAGRMEAAAALFTVDGLLVLKPGQHAIGRGAVAEGYAAIGAAFPVFAISSRMAIECGSVALHHSVWSAGNGLKGEVAIEMAGTTSDVLVKQPDGRWLVAIDNAWRGAGLT